MDGTADPKSMWYIALSDGEMSWVGALITLGSLFGGMTGGIFMDMLGRKTTLLVISVPYILGWLLMVLTVNTSNDFFHIIQYLFFIILSLNIIIITFSNALYWLLSGRISWRNQLCGIS